MHQLTGVISDRGSKYAVSGGAVADRAAVDAMLKALKKNKKFARATHNSWAAVLADGNALKADDGESGAGNIILAMLEREGVIGHMVIVTRWYGGKKLGGDRFRHVQECTRAYLAEFCV